MKRDLFICNSVYQVLVALWLVYMKGKDTPSDIILSDHMNNSESIAERLKDAGVFQKVYCVKSFDFARFRIRQTKKERICMSIFPNQFLRKFVVLSDVYSSLYAANMDNFTSLVLNALAHKKQDVKFYIFEDGMFTYSRLFEQDYRNTYIPVNGIIKKMLHALIYRNKTIFGNVDGMFVFNPDNMFWHPTFKVEKMAKISRCDANFRSICNCVFGYNEYCDTYDRKYIFLEEAFYAEGNPVNDLEVIEAFAGLVGKENIMVKIHPRNPVNRFRQLGYKTNENTSIPWEVILMNVGEITDSILVTVSSSAALNPILIFGMDIQVRSIYNCVDHAHSHSRLLAGEIWKVTHSMFEKYSDKVKMCKCIEEIM